MKVQKMVVFFEEEAAVSRCCYLAHIFFSRKFQYDTFLAVKEKKDGFILAEIIGLNFKDIVVQKW